MRSINHSINPANDIPFGPCARPGKRPTLCCFACARSGRDGLERLNEEPQTVKSAPLSDELLLLAADKFRMLGDSTRLAILRCLMDVGEANVTEIVAGTGRELANVSKHLK
ncbi:MAG: helix-turn-helix transcriptional regulator, partial [Pirellulales bacterium]|nr:helix-turn-helix transcriptional regulator [Pirellulales bacterium]